MWKALKLGDVCKLRNGRAYKKPELLSDGKYKVLRVGNFFTNNKWYYSDLELDESKYCDNEDLLYAWSASFGPFMWNDGKSIYHYHIWRVDIDEALIDKKFLYYWFMYDKELIKTAYGTGTTMMHVSKSSMEKRNLLVPSIPEQKHIVTKLDAAFAEIDKMINASLKFKNETTSLYENLKSKIFFKQKNYIENYLKEVCEKITDGTHQTPKYFDNGYIFLSSKNVKTKIIDWKNIKYIDEKQHIEMQKRVSPKIGDILLAKNGTTGMGAIVDKNVNFDIYVSLALLRSKGDIIPEYLLEFINSQSAREQFTKRTKGIGVQNLHLQEIREVKIRYPKSKIEQKNTVKKINLLNKINEKLISIKEEKINNLIALKNSILKNELQKSL